VIGLLRAHGGVERGVARAELAAAVAPAPLLHAAHRDGQLRAGGHLHRGVEDAVLLGADQLLAVQQEQRAVGAVRDFEEGDGAGVVHLSDPGAVAGFVQCEPDGVVEVGGEQRDDGQGAVGDGLAGQDGGEELGDLGHFVQRGHGADPPLALWRTQRI
jgi:hypothetical protein